MLLTTVAIAGGAVVTGSVKLYRDNKRKKEYPWTVAAERIAKKQGTHRLAMSSYRKKGTVLENGLMAKGKAVLNSIKEQQLALFPADPRQQQLLEISNGIEESESSEAEKKMDHYFAVSLTSLGLATAGALFYSPLTLLTIPALAYVDLHFFRSQTLPLLKEKRVGVALIEFITAAGLLVTGHYFVAALNSSLLFLNRKLLIKTEDHSQKSLINIFGTEPRFVWIQKEGPSGKIEVEIAFESLSIGDMVVVHAGETIPIDGIIADGNALVDQRTLTGESQPIEKSAGDGVFASTMVLSGQIYIQVEKTGKDTVAAKIGDILIHTSDFKSSVQSRADRIIDQGALPTLALSGVALPLYGATSAMTVLFAAFGYQMKIAAPLGVLNFLRIASENGVLIKDGRSLELLSEVDTFVFDKTGTLTEEEPTVGTIHTLNGHHQEELLTYAAAAEYKQTHPIARAIRQEAHERGLALPPIGDVNVEVGYGLKVSVKSWQDDSADAFKLVRVGSKRFMEMSGITIPSEIKQIQQSAHEEGLSLVYVAIDDQLGGAIELMPTIRPEAKQIVCELQKRNMSIYIISGDHEKPTKKLAQALGIDDYFAEVLPQDKASLIEELQEKGKSVCFVGDGINDSIALKKANVSVSLCGASTIATDTASIVLMDSTLKQLVSLLDLAFEMDSNLKTSTAMTVIPGLICVGGVFFFHFGLISSVLLYNAALALSVSNSFLPLIKHNKKALHTEQ